MAKIYQNRGGTLTPILDTDKFVNVDNVNQSIAGTKTFSGTVNVPDQTVGDYSQKAANTKFVQDTVTNLISCREETYTAPAGGIPENTNITIPSSQKYIVGSKMLEVYYNGLIEYRGDQYDEVGTVNTESGTITIKHAMEEGDKLVFRINGLCDADSVSDAVHITGTETITGTKTFTVSPNVPTVTDISDSSTKIASTKFVHDLVDGFVTCVDEVLDITTAQASGSLVTLPQGLQYIVGSNALMVSYNGAVCHHGEQFNEYGTTGQLSNQIEILFDLSVGDQLGFRIQGLNRIDDFTDVVHQSGAETITGTKTFNVSPVLPEMAMSTNDRTAASTEFVHDMVDGFMMCYDEVMTVSTAVTSGSNITLPAGMQYVVGSHMLMMSYNGTVCHIGEQFNEVGTTGQNSSTIQVLFDLRVGDKLGFRLHGISEAVQIPYDVVHTSGSETISGVKSFNSSPVVPSPNLGDYSNNVVTSKWVKDISTAAVYVSPDGDDSNSGMSAAESVKTIGRGIEISENLSGENKLIHLILAGGTYTDEVLISTYKNCLITLTGNVVFEAPIAINIESHVVVSESTYSFTVSGFTTEVSNNSSLEIYTSSCNISNGKLRANGDTFIRINCPTTISRSSDSGNHIVAAFNNSTIYFASTLQITVNTVYSALRCGSRSLIIVGDTLTINANGCSYAIFISENSCLISGSNVAITGSNISACGINVGNTSYFAASGLTIGDCLASNVGAIGFIIQQCSSAVVGGNISIYGSDNNVPVLVQQAASLQMGSGTSGTQTFNVKGSSTSAIIVQYNSSFRVTSGTTIVNAPNGGNICFSLQGCSFMRVNNINISGAWSDSVVYAMGSSVFNILNNATVTNNATGRRFYVKQNSCIYTAAAGANRLPGSTAGVAESSTYGTYV